jgi:hypothetical protein
LYGYAVKSKAGGVPTVMAVTIRMMWGVFAVLFICILGLLVDPED